MFAENTEALLQFSRAASHDLQEPLRAVEAYLKKIDRTYRGRVDPDHDAWLDAALCGVGRVQELLAGMLAVVRTDQVVERGPTDLAEVVDLAIANARMAIEEAGAVVVRTNLPTVQGQRMSLVQLFQNLILNAVKYRRPAVPPTIRIEAHAAGERWGLVVRDNGIGIPADKRAQIFRPFARAHEGASYPGTGLGLFLCKKIVERHGGEIGFESVDGHGTQIHFTLPKG